jgi:hypothetical protein
LLDIRARPTADACGKQLADGTGDFLLESLETDLRFIPRFREVAGFAQRIDLGAIVERAAADLELRQRVRRTDNQKTGQQTVASGIHTFLQVEVVFDARELPPKHHP